MEMVTDHVRWSAAGDERAFLAWTADRAAVGSASPARHLAPLAAVGRVRDGTLVVDVVHPVGTPLSDALDTIGTPTNGVAVTLSVPLLELAVCAHAGAVLLGLAGLDDVIVDDAGAVVLRDRPPCSDGQRRSDQDGCRILLVAARLVWERTDPRDPVRPAVDAALADAVDGDVDAVRTALGVVRAAAAPRPVRWDRPADLVFGEPADAGSRPTDSVSTALQDVVENGIPLGRGRRVPLRHGVVGVVVAAGATAAAVFTIG